MTSKREQRPGADDLPDDWQPPEPPPTREQVLIREGRLLWFACYSLLVHSGITPRGSKPKRPIPETPGELLAYATELIAFCKKTGRATKDQAALDLDAVERRADTLRWLLESPREDTPP